MAFDGNGTFSRIMNWVQDAAASILIKADRHDQQDDDFAAGLTNCITKDGQTQPTANIPMNGHKLINLADPVNATDAANKQYVDALKTFKTGLELSGADANGQMKFTSSTGANGLSFTGADLSWLARLADATATPPTKNRLAMNDKPDGSGNDVITANDDGSLVALKVTAPLYEVKAATGSDTINFMSSDGASVFMSLKTPAAAQGDGTLSIGGSVNFTYTATGDFKAPASLYAGAALLDITGNLTGTAWATWGSTNAFTAISSRIETRATAWANDRVSSMQYRKVSQGSSGTSTNFTAPAGAVITGYSREAGQAGQVASLYFMYLQVYDPVRGWVGFSG